MSLFNPSSTELQKPIKVKPKKNLSSDEPLSDVYVRSSPGRSGKD